MEQKQKEKWIKAGEIASLLMKKALALAKPDVALLEIAEAIEKEAEKLKVKLAFPVNLSINEIAAHYTPCHEDKTLASGLLKIDLGVSIDGCISDIARSVDLTKEGKYTELIKASEEALKSAIKTAKCNIELREIGKSIHAAISKYNFTPIINLCGHELNENLLHAGATIPNFDNNSTAKLAEGFYAIEPFATAGEGYVQDGKPSGIYMLENPKNIRDLKSREILKFIQEEYKTLPFCSRWLVKKFGTRALLSLRMLEQEGILHQFAQLVERTKMPVSQCENTILVEKDKVIVLTD